MGWLSTLGKIGGIVAAPFTGGASLIPTIASVAGDVGSVLGKQQQGKAQGQISQAELQQRQDANALASYQAQQAAQNQAAQTDLQRQQFSQDARGTNAKDALIASLLGSGSYAPTSVSGGKASGGLLASLNANPGALAAMQKLASQASAGQDTPASFTGGNLLTAPKLTALPQVDSGGWLSTLANIGQLAGAAAPYLSKGGGPQNPDDGGNGASKPQAVDVMGAIPGGAVVPRTKNPYLLSTDYYGITGGR
jgi:hypothetical protein